MGATTATTTNTGPAAISATNNGSAGRLTILFKNNSIAAVLLLAAEIWLGYLFWSVNGYFIVQVYFYSLSDTGANGGSFAFFIVYLVPFLLCIPRAGHFIGSHLSFFRIPAIFCLLMSLLEHTVRAVFSCLPVAGLLLAFGAACSHHYVGPDDGWCGREPSHNLTASCRHTRFFWGLVGGLLLSMMLRMGFLTVDPQFNYSLSHTTVFFFVGLVAFALVWTSEISDRRNETLKQAMFIARKHMPIKKLDIYKRTIRELAWIPTSLFLAGTLFIIFWIYSQSEALPRWVGVTSEATLGYGWGIMVFYIAGMLLAPTLFSGIIWFLMLILGCGLAGAVLNGGGYFGGLLMAFALPSMLFYTFTEISRIARYGIALGVGFFLVLIYLVAAFGVLLGTTAPWGVPFHHRPDTLLWLAVMLMAVLLIVMHVMNNIGGDYDGRCSSPKKIFKGLVGNPKPVKPTWPVLITLILIFALGIFLVIGRSALNTEKLKDLPQNAGENLKVMSFNIYQGQTQKGMINVRDVAKVIENYGAHVVGLQESDAVHIGTNNLDPVNYIAGTLNMDSFFGLPNVESTAGASILSRTKLSGFFSEAMAATTEKSLTRPYVQAELQYNNTKITVVNVHLELAQWGGGRDTDLQIDFITSRINSIKGPLILVGDFNSVPDSPQVAKIRATGLINAYEHYNNINTTTTTTIINNTLYNATHTSNKFIDYIFYRDLLLVDAGIYTSKKADLNEASDHFPVYASFRTKN